METKRPGKHSRKDAASVRENDLRRFSGKTSRLDRRPNSRRPRCGERLAGKAAPLRPRYSPGCDCHPWLATASARPGRFRRGLGRNLACAFATLTAEKGCRRKWTARSELRCVRGWREYWSPIARYSRCRRGPRVSRLNRPHLHVRRPVQAKAEKRGRKPFRRPQGRWKTQYHPSIWFQTKCPDRGPPPLGLLAILVALRRELWRRSNSQARAKSAVAKSRAVALDVAYGEN